MRHILRKALLALAGAAIFSTSAMADDFPITIGATDNSDGWYGAHYSIGDIAANETVTLEFTAYTASDEELSAANVAGGWQAWFAWALNFWGGDRNLFMRADGYGWKNTEAKEDPINTNVAGWFTYNGNDYSGNFRDIINGANVKITIMRVGAELRIFQDITTTTSAKYRHYFVTNYGDEADKISADLAIERSHFVLNNVTHSTSEETTILGTMLGALNSANGFAAGERGSDFILADNSTLTLHFKNYSKATNLWNSWVLEMQNGVNYFDLVAGNSNKWGALQKDGSDNDITVINKTNWPATDAEVIDKMDGADVVLTIERHAGSVDITAVHTPVSGSAFTLAASFTPVVSGFAGENVSVRLLTDHSFIDLLPVSTTISSYGWSTFSSDYALDFSKADAGLEAYIITGRDGAVVTKSLATGTVPAGTGLLLKGDASTAYNIPIVGSSDTDVSGNLLVAGAGAAVSYEAGKTKYVLGVNGSKAEFQKIVEGTPATVDRGKAYLQFNEVVAAPQLSFFGDVTGIEDAVKSDELRVKSYYNLAGQRIAQPTKGLYIVNGKKVVVK